MEAPGQDQAIRAAYHAATRRLEIRRATSPIRPMIGAGRTVDVMRFQLGILCIISGVAVVVLGPILLVVIAAVWLFGIV